MHSGEQMGEKLLGADRVVRYTEEPREVVTLAKRESVVQSDPEILGGTPVFIGTRVPLRNLIDYLERGYTLDQFLDAFPSVSHDQALQALETAHDLLAADARSPG